MQLGDVFSGYAENMQAVRAAQSVGNFNKAESLVADLATGNNNYTLSLLEKGRLQFLANNWQESRNSFEKAYAVIEDERDKAKIRLSRGVENMAALLSSDNAKGYQIPVYEQSMLHTYQALNYLYLGNLEGALVEIRRGNQVTQSEVPQSTSTLEGTEGRYDKNKLSKLYPSMDGIIGQQKTSTHNAYTYYVSALLYEVAGQLNDAYIDYKKALAIAPDNIYIQKDVMRLATKLQMSSDLAKYTEQIGPYKSPADNTGDVVILLEQGVVAAKNELGLNLPIYTSQYEPRFFSFSLPVYQDRVINTQLFTVSLEQKSYSSQKLVTVASLAAIDLKEQIPELVTRQTLRLIAKEKLRSTMSRKGGDLGNILAAIYNMTSENADTRSWLTLPENVQIMRLSMPSGQQILNLSGNNKTEKIELNVNAKRITLIKVTAIGSQQNYQIINL
ncbi:COG3014 family protein [Paraglaciecola sp. L3A3]|uniref:COG3014 family protein n=1 Tax=Paraglaciecola sp. L3A3 TaxID=2686358 RepID=UPI00131C18B1|nr:hypothetical protein [Paraglaciecola sp. L3A3]